MRSGVTAVMVLLGWWSVVTAVAPADPATIWSAVSGGLTIVWARADITVYRGGIGGETLFSVRAAADRAWATTAAKDPRPCSEDRQVQILSVVGSLVSLSIQADGTCAGAAHPYASHRWAVMDISRLERGYPAPVRLIALLPEAELLAALVADPVVRKALGSTAPQSLADLFAALAAQPIEVGGCAFTFGEDELSAFAVYGLSGGDRMSVRIGLPARGGKCGAQITQLGLDLPMPDRLRAELVQASSRRAGFLLRDLTAVASGAETTFRLGSSPGSPPAVP